LRDLGGGLVDALDLQCFRDLSSDVRLNGEYILELSIVFL
jgi:hypothetical protein